MGWHVMIGDKQFGPMEAETIGNMLRERKLFAGTFVKDENGGTWLAIEQSPFKSMVRKPPARAIDWVTRLLFLFAALELLNFAWHSWF